MTQFVPNCVFSYVLAPKLLTSGRSEPQNFSLRDGVSHAKSSERRKMVQTELPMFGKPLSEQCLKRSEIKFGYQCREFCMKLFPVRVLNPKVVDFAAYRIQVSNSDCIP